MANASTLLMRSDRGVSRVKSVYSKLSSSFFASFKSRVAKPELREAGGGAQLERLGLLASRDLQGLAEERLCLLDRVAVQFMISAEVPRWRRYISVAQANARWPASDA